MSISASLQKAAKLQEKIEDLRKQLTDLLNKARQELANTPALEIPATLRRVGKTQGGAARATAPVKTQKGARAVAKKEPTKLVKPPVAAKSQKTKGRSSLAGRKRAASPSGPLAPAVVKVLKGKGKPMRVADILEGLFKNGYTFSSPEPKKNLAARIYRLSGVRQVAGGLFTTV